MINMAKPNSSYTIEMQIQNGDNTRRIVDDIERGLKNIYTTATQDNLTQSLENANKQAKELSNQIKNIDINTDEATKQIDAFNRSAEKTIKDLEKQADALTYSLSQDGKLQRQRIEALKQELTTLGNTKKEKQRQKEIEKEIAQLQKIVVVGSDEELQKALQLNRATRATLRLQTQENRIRQQQARSNNTISKLVQADLKALKEKLKLQFQFIQSLRTTEGRYKAIKAAAAKAGQVGVAVGKAGLKGAGMVAGTALALGGIALSQSQNVVDKERQANRIKGALSKDEKQNLLSDLYIQTGADYTTIVDAINRVIGVLGTGTKPQDLLQAASTEIRYPGAAAIFRQQNAQNPTTQDFVAYGNRMKSIQTSTGASIEQITESAQKVANLRQSSFSNASMTELQSLYLALKNSGGFDTDEELDRAFRSFIRTQRDSNKSVFKLAKEWQQSGQWTRTAYGATNKQQVISAIGNLDLGSIEASSKTLSTDQMMTDAEKSAMKMRQIEESKNVLIMKLVEALAPVFDSIDVNEVSDFFAWVLTEMKPLFVKMVDDLKTITTAIKDIYGKFKEYGGDLGDLEKYSKMLIPGVGLISAATMKKANGGVVSMPSLVGERGDEMVVPLDYSRNARGVQLTQNLVQHFSMSGNETTALSLSKAVASRDFTRAMANNSFMNSRLGR